MMTKLDDRYTTLTAQLQSQYRNSNVADLIEGILAIKKRFILEAHNTLLSDCIDLSTAKGDALDLWGYLLGVSRWFPLETTPEMRYNLWNFNNKKFYELNFWCPLNGHFEYLNDDEYRDILLYLLRKQNIYPNLKISNELVKEHFDKYSADLKIVDSREMEMIVEYDHSIMPHKLCYFLMLKDILHRPAGVGIKVEDKPAPPPPPPPPPEPEGRGKSYVINTSDGTMAGGTWRIAFDEATLNKILEEYGGYIEKDKEPHEKKFWGINYFTKEEFEYYEKIGSVFIPSLNSSFKYVIWSEEGYQLFGIHDNEWGDFSEVGETMFPNFRETGWVGNGGPGLNFKFENTYNELETQLDLTMWLDKLVAGEELYVVFARFLRYPAREWATSSYDITQYGFRGLLYNQEEVSVSYTDLPEGEFPPSIWNYERFWSSPNTNPNGGGFFVIDAIPDIWQQGYTTTPISAVWGWRRSRPPAVSSYPLQFELNVCQAESEIFSFYDFMKAKYRNDEQLYIPNDKYDFIDYLKLTRTDKRFKRS